MKITKTLNTAINDHTSWQRTLIVLFVAQICTAIGFASFVPFLPLYVKDLGSSTGMSVELLVGLAFSAQSFTMMIASPFWGSLADRYGRKMMVERAMFGGAVVLLLMAFVQTAEQLVALRAIQGAITGTVAAANALAAAVTPRRRTGFAMGMLQVGLGAGVALGPMLGGWIADLYGYSATFYVTAGLLLLGGVLVWLGVEEDFTPVAEKQAQKRRYLDEWRSKLAETGMAMTYGLRFLTQLGRMMIVPIAALFIATLLPDQSRLNTFTGLVIGISAATTTISSVFLGQLGDRTGHRRIVIVCGAIAGGLYLLQSQVTAGWQLLALQALVGVCLGGIMPAISALLARYSRVGEEGTVYGLDNSVVSAAGVLAPLFSTAIADWYNLRATFAATAVLFLATALLANYFLPKPRLGRQEYAIN